MSRNRWITVLLAVALLVVCGLSLAVVLGTYGMLRQADVRLPWLWGERGQATATLTETHRFEVGPEPLLVVSTAAGDVTVEGRPDARAIEVLQTVEGRGSDAASALAAAKGATVRVEADEAVIRLVYEAGEPLGFGDRERAAVSFVIAVPPATRLDLETKLGDIEASGTHQGGELASGFGRARASDLLGALSVTSHNGDVEIARVAAAGADIALSSDFGAVSAREVEGRDISVRSQNGALSVEGLRASGTARLESAFGSIELGDFSAANLVVETQNGAVDLREGRVGGDVSIANSFGKVALSDLRAEGLRVRSGNGGIDLDGVGGPLDLSTSFGSIDVRGSEAARLALETANGGIDFAGSLDPASEHRAASDFGDIRLTLPPESSFDIQLETELGEIRSELPVTLSGELDAKTWIGQLGQGGPRLVVVTQNGDIELLAGPGGAGTSSRPDGAPSAATAPPGTPATLSPPTGLPTATATPGTATAPSTLTASTGTPGRP